MSDNNINIPTAIAHLQQMLRESAKADTPEGAKLQQRLEIMQRMYTNSDTFQELQSVINQYTQILYGNSRILNLNEITDLFHSESGFKYHNLFYKTLHSDDLRDAAAVRKAIYERIDKPALEKITDVRPLPTALEQQATETFIRYCGLYQLHTRPYRNAQQRQELLDFTTAELYYDIFNTLWDIGNELNKEITPEIMSKTYTVYEYISDRLLSEMLTFFKSYLPETETETAAETVPNTERGAELRETAAELYRQTVSNKNFNEVISLRNDIERNVYEAEDTDGRIAHITQQGRVVSKQPAYMHPITNTAITLLEIIAINHAKGSKSDRTVYSDINEYMTLRGLTDRKEARKQVRGAINSIGSTAITFTDEDSQGNIRSYEFNNIIESGKLQRDGTIEIIFTQWFYDTCLAHTSVMPYPIEALKLNAKYNPNSNLLIRKIAELKKMNIGKPTEDIISVATLLNVSLYIPTERQVKELYSRNYTDRIINPLERDLNALEERKIVSWEYCHAHGDPLTDAELQQLDYGLFKTLNVKFTWITPYPEYVKSAAERKQLQQDSIAKATEEKNSKRRGRKTKTRDQTDSSSQELQQTERERTDLEKEYADLI